MKVNVLGWVLLGCLSLSSAVFAATEDELRAMVTDARGAILFGDFENAKGFCDKAIEAKPDLSEAYAVRAEAKLELNDMESAKADAQKAVELAPEEMSTNPAYFVLAAHALDNEGDAAKALGLATKAIELSSLEPAPGYYQLRADIHKAMGNQELADADLAKADELLVGAGAAQ